MLKLVKLLLRKTLNLVELDIVNISDNPKHTFLGIKSLPIRTIIDVGANRGQFGKYLSGLFPDAHIYCFEPLPEPFKELSKWVKEQGGKVEAFNIALGDIEGNKEMLYHSDHSPSSSFLRTTETCESFEPLTKKQVPLSVRITTLDKWFNALSSIPEREILIKLDVQGYEAIVIRGGSETFKNAKICILEVCLDQLYEDQATFKDLSSNLFALGYRYVGNLEQFYAEDGHVVFIDAVFMK